jgi:hypothetical protein
VWIFGVNIGRQPFRVTSAQSPRRCCPRKILRAIRQLLEPVRRWAAAAAKARQPLGSPRPRRRAANYCRGQLFGSRPLHRAAPAGRVERPVGPTLKARFVRLKRLPAARLKPAVARRPASSSMCLAAAGLQHQVSNGADALDRFGSSQRRAAPPFPARFRLFPLIPGNSGIMCPLTFVRWSDFGNEWPARCRLDAAPAARFRSRAADDPRPGRRRFRRLPSRA